MIRYHTQDHAPHLVLEIDGPVSGPEVERALSDLPTALRELPANFVALILTKDAGPFKNRAVGPLFYYVTHLFDADPGLCVFVNGGHPPHPGLKAFIEKVGVDDQVAFVVTREEADDRIEQYREAKR